MDICGGAWYGAAEESPCPWTQHLRNAISKVQRQKQRPTAARICKAVRQCVDNVSLDEISEWLNAAVRSGEILLVNNDGVLSYREPRQNQSNLAPALRGNRPPAVSELFRQAECGWNFAPQYEPFREFMRQPVNGSIGWSFGQPLPYDPYVQYGDRATDQYGGWLGSFAAVDPQLTFDSDPVQHRFRNHISESTVREASATCLSEGCDENWNLRDCGYGVLQSDVVERSTSAASHRDVTAQCGQEVPVIGTTDFGVNSSCEERRTAQDEDKAELTDVYRSSVGGTAGTVADRQQAEPSGTESEDVPNGEEVSDEVSGICSAAMGMGIPIGITYGDSHPGCLCVWDGYGC